MDDLDSSEHWYIVRDGRQHGPVSHKEIGTLARQGHLRPNDDVWRPGYETWRSARDVPGLWPSSSGRAPNLRQGDERAAAPAAAVLQAAKPAGTGAGPGRAAAALGSLGQLRAPPGESSYSRKVEATLVGVRGWLLLLCSILTIFAPLASAAALAGIFLHMSPHFAAVPGSQNFFVALALTVLLLNIGSIYVGVALWRRWPGAHVAARSFLLISFAVGCLAPFLVYLFVNIPAGQVGAIAVSAMPDVVRTALSTGIWCAYLHWSKRVRATFGPM